MILFTIVTRTRPVLLDAVRWGTTASKPHPTNHHQKRIVRARSLDFSGKIGAHLETASSYQDILAGTRDRHRFLSNPRLLSRLNLSHQERRPRPAQLCFVMENPNVTYSKQTLSSHEEADVLYHSKKDWIIEEFKHFCAHKFICKSPERKRRNLYHLAFNCKNYYLTLSKILHLHNINKKKNMLFPK